MEPKNVLKFSVRDRVDDANVGLSHVPLSLIGDFQKDVADFLRGSGRDLDLHKVIVSIEEGSLAFVASGLLEAHSLWHDLRSLEQSNSLTQIDVRRAAVILRWQAAA
ncbi:hypothetical protein LP419_25120 [Massilia sp. H-1]|nr:hypothetical protein LP419_25120 [Massilia sp. H-1]